MKRLAVNVLAAFILCALAVSLVLLLPDVSWASGLDWLTSSREASCILNPSHR
jgi:hypothetical protein